MQAVNIKMSSAYIVVMVNSKHLYLYRQRATMMFFKRHFSDDLVIQVQYSLFPLKLYSFVLYTFFFLERKMFSVRFSAEHREDSGESTQQEHVGVYQHFHTARRCRTVTAGLLRVKHVGHFSNTALFWSLPTTSTQSVTAGGGHPNNELGSAQGLSLPLSPSACSWSELLSLCR